jgi:hypothetical protein
MTFLKKEPSLFTWDGVEVFKIYEGFSDSDKLGPLESNNMWLYVPTENYKPRFMLGEFYKASVEWYKFWNVFLRESCVPVESYKFRIVARE